MNKPCGKTEDFAFRVFFCVTHDGLSKRGITRSPGTGRRKMLGMRLADSVVPRGIVIIVFSSSVVPAETGLSL